MKPIPIFSKNNYFREQSQFSAGGESFNGEVDAFDETCDRQPIGSTPLRWTALATSSVTWALAAPCIVLPSWPAVAVGEPGATVATPRGHGARHGSTFSTEGLLVQISRRFSGAQSEMVVQLCATMICLRFLVFFLLSVLNLPSM